MDDQVHLLLGTQKQSAAFMDPYYGRIVPNVTGIAANRISNSSSTYIMMIKMRFVTDDNSILMKPPFVILQNQLCPLKPYQKPVCRAPLDNSGHHAASHCKSVKYPLHNRLLVSLQNVCDTAGLMTTRKDVGYTTLGANEVNLKNDMRIFGPVTTDIDVTVRSAHVAGAVKYAANGKPDLEHHVKRAEKQKHDKYDAVCKRDGISFRPFAVSAQGGFGREARILVGRLASIIGARYYVDVGYTVSCITKYIQNGYRQKMARNLLTALNRLQYQSFKRLARGEAPPTRNFSRTSIFTISHSEVHPLECNIVQG